MCRRPSARSRRSSALDGIEWHLIGPLQSNKARAAAAHFAWVQTVDRLANRRTSRGRAGQRAAAAERLRPGQHQRRGEQERLRARSRRSTLPQAVAQLPRLALRGFMGIAEETADVEPPARAVPHAARLVRQRACDRACPSTRCRWACRRTWKPRSPKARRWCASAARCSARVQEKLSRRAHEHHLHRRRQHGARAHRRPDRAWRRRRTRFAVVEVDAEARATICGALRHRDLHPGRARRRGERRRDRDRGQAAERARGRARAGDAAQAAGRAHHRRRHPPARPVALAARLSPPGARHAEHAGADRRRHRRTVCAVGRRRRRPGARGARCSRRSARPCGASARTSSTPSPRCPAAVRRTCSTSSRRSNRRRASSASNRRRRTGSRSATFSGATRLAEQSDTEPVAAARAGDLERRHDRARRRHARRSRGDECDRRGGEGRG